MVKAGRSVGKEKGKAKKGMRRCRHCYQGEACYYCVLCELCFAIPCVRDSYLRAMPREPERWEPTDAPPGSPGKLEVLIRRQELNQPLWHPLDATYG